MKLCSLRFKNLNSLAGEWRVDFEAPEFRGGLFAITGPTGAGKSTLLDALCLALYGRTPRLGKVSSSDNEIMTRGAKECFAEAVFETGGVRYSAFWSQKKTSRKGAAKEFQQPKCRFSRLGENEEVLADAATEMEAAVKRVCRLDFERFTRTVMLPQGGFAAFLEAKDEARAKMLEELTGAEIYRRISREVFERAKRENAELEKIRASAAELSPLGDQARAETERRMAESHTREAALRESEKTIAAALEWYGRSDTLARTRASLEASEAELEREREKFAPLAESLALAERAANAADLFDSLKRSRGNLEKSGGEVLRRDAEVLAGTIRLTDAEQAYRVASAELERLKKSHEESLAIWEQVHDLDRQIEKVGSENHDLSAKIDALKIDSAALQERDHASLRELEEAKHERGMLEKRLAGAREEKDQAQAEVYRGDLSELASRLEDGKPCPLCGALHHPEPFRGELREETLELHQRAKKAAQKVADLERRLKNCEENISRLQVERKGITMSAQSVQKDIDDREKELKLGKRSAQEQQERRRELFGDRDVNVEAQREKQQIEKAEKRLRDAEAEQSAAQISAARAETELNRARQSAAARKEELDAAESAFADRIQRLGFAAEAAWKEAVLDEKEIERLRAEARGIDERAESLKNDLAALAAGEKQLGAAPELPREGLDAAQIKNRAELTQLLKDRGADEQRLKSDEECRRRLAELGEKEERQKKVCDLWSSLGNKIGSATGDKFSKYVQTLTFRRLVAAANVQLAGLSERYRLRVSGSDSLQIDVADLWQGGEIRASRNLSGGESFVISLALALALSHGMKEVRVDSLFLDEGFGTLDEDTLETVLDCLNRLREGGKTVGVISHVAALRDRAACQIKLIPGPNGRSTLTGPGCTRLG